MLEDRRHKKRAYYTEGNPDEFRIVVGKRVYVFTPEEAKCLQEDIEQWRETFGHEKENEDD